ncbi:hypothetical protein P389DRAFT_166732 [Cystobasidium minutum MCA 4210]|uniref:uncharacterized protein n=1 Tax=Cystobasidium minutum MCA 4210 TaxID=1397322 RepID=UPI0034CD4092|eukprot:jgi/Rhomi1/166732/fgenesh1_kg.2_\
MTILFSDVCLLFEKIARASRSCSKGKRKQGKEDSPVELLSSWIAALVQPPARDGLVIYRLVFPEHDIRRRYGLKETLLAKELPFALGFRPSPELLSWDGRDAVPGTSLYSNSTKYGCFGLCLQEALAQRTDSSNASHRSSLDIHTLDSLLDELASHCDYSSLDVKKILKTRSRRSQHAILLDLFSPLSPSEASYLAQIILRDLSPLLYPIPSLRSDIALLEHNTANIEQLSLPDALRAWHWTLPGIYKFQADLDASFAVLGSNPIISEKSSYTREERHSILKHLATPAPGRRVEIPSATKGRSCSSVTAACMEAGLSFAEIKYDGERMQIHVNLEASPCITIFSKSKRDSTLDRYATHPIILAALGLPFSLSNAQPSDHLLRRASSSSPAVRTGGTSSPPRQAILEAEMVAYNEDIEEIDEFSNLPLCMNQTSPQKDAGPYDSSQTRSNGSGETAPHRHLALVFFDLLLLNGESLVFEPYTRRRAALEAIITPIQGYVQLAERTRLDFQSLTLDIAKEQLIRTFAKCIVNRNEGLMIKPANSLYNDSRPSHKWIKLKRDYIPGLGDTVSCSIVGASWSKERGRELRVPTSCFTTFWVGALENEIELQNGSEKRPRYRVLFSVSHLPNRQALLRANELINFTGGVSTAAWKGRVAENWTFDLAMPSNMKSHVAHILAKPLVFELFGAGFARPRGSPFYELRFPRVSAIHETRQPSETVTLAELQRLAKDAASWIGSEAESEVDDLWSRHSTTSGEDNDQEAIDWRTRQEEHWIRKLTRAEKPKRKRERSTVAMSSDLQLQRQPSPICLPLHSAGSHVAKSNVATTSSKPSEILTEPLASTSFVWTALPSRLAADIHMTATCRVTSLYNFLFASTQANTGNTLTPCVIFVRKEVAESAKQYLADIACELDLRTQEMSPHIWLFIISNMHDVPLHAGKLGDLPPQCLFPVY